MFKRGFASDNNAGVHPDILEAISKVNYGHSIAYGDDPVTAKAIDDIKKIFGDDAVVHFVFNGTAANVLGLDASTMPFNSIICSETAHINTDECGAPERFTGCKLLSIPTPDGKLTPALIRKHLHGFGFEHHSQPRVVSVTQSTEMGTVYSPDEIQAICNLAHEYDMIVHMDGARISNAAASLGLSLKETAGGADILSFGGTKNGMMYGEALVFLNSSLAKNFKYQRKQAMQLASKMRFISAQFSAFLENDLWLRNAVHANQMAKLLYDKVRDIPGIQITQEVQANGVFAIIPSQVIPELQKEYFFYVWDEFRSEVRWMTSFDTTVEDVTGFASKLREFAAKYSK